MPSIGFYKKITWKVYHHYCRYNRHSNFLKKTKVYVLKIENLQLNAPKLLGWLILFILSLTGKVINNLLNFYNEKKKFIQQCHDKLVTTSKIEVIFFLKNIWLFFFHSFILLLDYFLTVTNLDWSKSFFYFKWFISFSSAQNVFVSYLTLRYCWQLSSWCCLGSGHSVNIVSIAIFITLLIFSTVL